jgi:hypothetical protein
VYNNPDAVLLPFVRSRTVIECAGISKINLTTGAQAITGSTRMQACVQISEIGNAYIFFLHSHPSISGSPCVSLVVS